MSSTNNSTFVKICGLTNLEDARVAVDAGADLLGFIFYAKSPRYVAPEQVATIACALRDDGARLPRLVGVFVNASVAEIQRIAAQVGLDHVQLHGNENADWFAPLAGRAYKAVRPADAASAQASSVQFAPLGCATGPTLMIDAYDPQAYGGTGKQTDWHVAADLARQYDGLLLAGGLTPENVAAAIELVQPWGVDVASGVEAEPGRKDHAKVRAFVQAVRQSKPPTR